MLTQPFAIPTALIFLVAIPLAICLIPRNRFYGFRIQKTLDADRVWYLANRFTGVMLMLASIVYATVTLVWPYNKHASDNFDIFLVHLAGFGLPLLVALLLCWAYARRL